MDFKTGTLVTVLLFCSCVGYMLSGVCCIASARWKGKKCCRNFFTSTKSQGSTRNGVNCETLVQDEKQKHRSARNSQQRVSHVRSVSLYIPITIVIEL